MKEQEEKRVVVRVRAFIIDDGKLLVFRHLNASGDYYALPGGKLEPGETLQEGMEREIFEETGIKPLVGQLLAIYELIVPDSNIHSLEFFYFIKNSSDFSNLDISKATHSHEIVDHRFVDPNSQAIVVLPEVAKKIALEIRENGTGSWEIQHIQGH